MNAQPHRQQCQKNGDQAAAATACGLGDLVGSDMLLRILRVVVDCDPPRIIREEAERYRISRPMDAVMIVRPVEILLQIIPLQRGIPGAQQIDVKQGSLCAAALISPAFRPALLLGFHFLRICL